MAGVRAAYDALVAATELKPDAAQAEVADRLEALEVALAIPVEKLGLMARLRKVAAPPAPRGLYIWGGVGRGKSMLMDLFYSHSDISPKRRVHFHEFMLESHAALHAERQKGGPDPIPAVAAGVAAGARLLAFDEMQVKDIADAAILSRLFTALFEHGVTVVTTSNRAPIDLYKDGLNRQLFLPFIALIQQKCDVITLDGPTDYRLERRRRRRCPRRFSG
jgi:cell division protein ZapE